MCKKKKFKYNILVEEKDSFCVLVKRNVPFPSINYNIPYFSQTELYIFYKKKLLFIPFYNCSGLENSVSVF